jgi:uncharacterized membrane protein YiaA
VKVEMERNNNKIKNNNDSRDRYTDIFSVENFCRLLCWLIMIIAFAVVFVNIYASAVLICCCIMCCFSTEIIRKLKIKVR